MFAGMNGDGIYRSSDHGNTWTKTDINNSLLAHQLVFTFCVKDNALYAGASNGIYKSTDGGATFGTAVEAFPAGQADVTANVQTAVGTLPGTQFWMQGAAQPWLLPDPARPGWPGTR